MGERVAQEAAEAARKADEVRFAIETAEAARIAEEERLAQEAAKAAGKAEEERIAQEAEEKRLAEEARKAGEERFAVNRNLEFGTPQGRIVEEVVAEESGFGVPGQYGVNKEVSAADRKCVLSVGAPKEEAVALGDRVAEEAVDK